MRVLNWTNPTDNFQHQLSLTQLGVVKVDDNHIFIEGINQRGETGLIIMQRCPEDQREPILEFIVD